MCLLFLSVLFPHYYAWWAYFNYYNDDFYSQFWHQVRNVNMSSQEEDEKSHSLSSLLMYMYKLTH